MKRQVTLIGVDGSRHVLACSDGPIQLGESPGLWGVAPIAVSSRRVAGVPGERVESVHTEPRLIALPVVINTSEPGDLDRAVAGLAPVLNPSTDCRIIVERDDGSAREIVARYYSGAGEQTVADHERKHITIPLVFKAHDPYWRALNDAWGREAGGIADAIGAGFTEIAATNLGDVEAWPEWTVTGPAENIEIVSFARGKIVRAIEVLPDGAQLRIRTDPADRGVWLDDFDAWPALALESDIWSLKPGLNRCGIRATGSIEGATGHFEMTWRPRWQTM